MNLGRIDDDEDGSLENVPKKRVRIRIPVVRSRSARQHKLTVVRRRPLMSRTKDLAYVTTADHVPRRIVVTRVRTLGSDKLIYPTETVDPVDYQSAIGKHKVTITRRRKLQSTPILSMSIKDKVRVTRKKLVAVRPILPTPTAAIITTGFFTVPSEYDEEYLDEENEDEGTTIEEEDHIVVTPSLEETPNLIDNKPDEKMNLTSLEGSSIVSEESTSDTPVIITDNFFFPLSDDEKDEEYEDDYFDMTTTTENVDNIAILMKDEHFTTEVISTKDENNIVSNKSDVEIKHDNIATSINQIMSEKPSDEQSVKTIQESDNATINITELIDISLENDNITTKESKTAVMNEDVPITEITSIEKDNDDNFMKEYTTTTSPEEQTTFIDDVTALNTPESTSLSDEEGTTRIPNTTEEHISSITEVITLSTKGENQEFSEDTEREMMPEAISEIPEELLRVLPIQPDVKIDSNSTQISLVETPLYNTTLASNFESVIPLATTKLSSITSNYLADSYIPSVIPLGANYTRETKSSIRRTSVLDTIPVTKVTTKIASPTPEEIEAGLTDDLYLSLSRLDFPEILPSKPATIGLETKSTPDLMLEPSTSVYYTETVVTSTRLRTYTYVVTQQNGLETKVTSSTTVRPRVTTLTLTVPVTVTVTPTVESSADFVSSVYNPVPIAGE